MLPEDADERAHEQHFNQAHAEVRGHLEGAQLEQSEAQALAFRRVHLVDAGLRAVRVARDVDQQITK